MHYFDTTTIEGDVYLHQIGNKQNNEPLVLTNAPLTINEDVKSNLKQYFLSHFKQQEYYHFYHEASLSMNEVYNYVSSIFDNITSIGKQSKYLAQTLYRKCTYPNIKSGEFYIVHFKNCLINGEMVDAVGLFKSENKDTFIKVLRNGSSFELRKDSGINLNKLDKGCLIFNTQKNAGYLISIIDNSNRGEAKYWVEDYLQVKRNNDSFLQTQNMVKLCKSYISQLPDEINKSEKAIMMNNVVSELNKDKTSINTIAKNVFGNKESFNSYSKNYQENNNLKFEPIFECNPNSIKRRAFGKLTTIKLDKNFDIYIHGGDELIERDYDKEKEMMYYKIYFKDER